MCCIVSFINVISGLFSLLSNAYLNEYFKVWLIMITGFLNVLTGLTMKIYKYLVAVSNDLQMGQMITIVEEVLSH